MAMLSVDSAHGRRARVWVLAGVGGVVFVSMSIVDGVGGGDLLWLASAASLLLAGCALGYAYPATWLAGGTAVVWVVQCACIIGRVAPGMARPGGSTGGVAGLAIILVVVSVLAPLFALGVGIGQRWNQRARARATQKLNQV